MTGDPGPAGLESVPEDWTRALAVVAHPDDMEFGASSAVARWTDQGKTVVYCMVTAGEAGIDSMEPSRCGPLRQADEVRSAAAVGVEVVEFLTYPDGLVTESIELRRDLAAAIRRHRPEVLITLNHRATWDGGWLNHADHRATGAAMLDAVRDAANRWIFPGIGGPPWSGVRFALFSNSPQATHAADIGSTIDRGVAALEEHRTYLDALDPDAPSRDPRSFLRGVAAAAGPRLGVDLATDFELVQLG
jgi:LmbE family N-acetylglucosaminyl deacetylase